MKKNNSKKEKEKYTLFTWDRDEYIRKDIEKKRNLYWYIEKYRNNLKISFVFSIVTFIMVLTGCFFIKNENLNTKNYITSTSGEIIHYKMTDEKRIQLKNALNVLRNGKTNQSKESSKTTEQNNN